jgi:hypothetical protein
LVSLLIQLCASVARHAKSRAKNGSNLFRLTSIPELQNHALDMRVNVEGRWAQKTYERLVAVARELDRKT